jgi:hypothetical protein
VLAWTGCRWSGCRVERARQRSRPFRHRQLALSSGCAGDLPRRCMRLGPRSAKRGTQPRHVCRASARHAACRRLCGGRTVAVDGRRARAVDGGRDGIHRGDTRRPSPVLAMSMVAQVPGAPHAWTELGRGAAAVAAAVAILYLLGARLVRPLSARPSHRAVPFPAARKNPRPPFNRWPGTHHVHKGSWR